MEILKVLAAILVVRKTYGFHFPLIKSSQDCTIRIQDTKPQPIVVDAASLQFLYPEPGEDHITIGSGRNVIIACPGGALTTTKGSFSNYNVSTSYSSCVGGSKFYIMGTILDFRSMSCSREAFHTARYTGRSCVLNGREIEIGFVIGRGRFVRLMNVCFDKNNNQRVIYSHFNLTKSIDAREHGVRRPYFLEDHFFEIKGRVSNLYKRSVQRATVNYLVGLPPESDKYIKDKSGFYLARGHLSAKADFVYATQQRATFHYINTSPQFQTFNGGNWVKAEMAVRTFADENGLDLIVYTGTYGVTTLPHEETGEEVEIFLYTDYQERAIPVPELFWKVVYDPGSKLGVALIGINNPYQRNVTKSIVCRDQSDEISWLPWKKHNINLGYSYACDVNDFWKAVPYFPHLDVDGLLVEPYNKENRNHDGEEQSEETLWKQAKVDSLESIVNWPEFDFLLNYTSEEVK